MDHNNDLPLELIREILLRLPVKSLLQFRCVCKSWLSLISDPSFAESHFELAAAPTRRCIFIQSPKALSYDLDALFHDGHASVEVSLPSSTSRVYVLASYRGFIMLHKYPQLIIWNPSTGAHKRISYSHMLSDVKSFHVDLLGNALLCGFGYDASMDDYLVVLAWKDKNKEGHFDFFSLRTNSWKNFEVDLPNRLMNTVWRCGLFFNGAFHWLACYCRRGDPILIFDLKERSFSEIPLPERVVMSGPCSLMELGGCLALCFWSNDKYRLEIWVMQEYKVQSSWTLYEIFGKDFQPVCLSNDGDIIGFDVHTMGFSKYSISGELLEHFSWQQFLYPRYAWYTMYTESLLSLPNDSEDKKKGRQECFGQLDAVTNDNHNEVKQRKRIRSAPTWTCDFYCN